MSLLEAKDKALEMAVKSLEAIDIQKRCDVLGLGPATGAKVRFRAFGKDVVLSTEDWEVSITEENSRSGEPEPVHPLERILVLKYLLCNSRLEQDGELISFRRFSGGRFYEAPFRARTCDMLSKIIGNDLNKLKRGLDKLDWERISTGDFGARIHAIGNIYLTLIYRLGDEEFAPGAEILFEPCALKAFDAESAAVLAGRICGIVSF